MSEKKPESVVMKAVRAKDFNKVKLLLNDFNVGRLMVFERDVTGCTSLIIACLQDVVAMAELLLSKGAKRRFEPHSSRD